MLGAECSEPPEIAYWRGVPRDSPAIVRRSEEFKLGLGQPRHFTSQNREAGSPDGHDTAVGGYRRIINRTQHRVLTYMTTLNKSQANLTHSCLS